MTDTSSATALANAIDLYTLLRDAIRAEQPVALATLTIPPPVMSLAVVTRLAVQIVVALTASTVVGQVTTGSLLSMTARPMIAMLPVFLTV